MLTLKILAKVTEYNIRSDAIPRQIPTSTKAVAPTFSEILRFEMLDIENLGQNIGSQHSQCPHSMENVNVYKSRYWAFIISSLRFPDVTISNFVTLKMFELANECQMKLYIL